MNGTNGEHRAAAALNNGPARHEEATARRATSDTVFR
jgi:hypothetical protein